MDKETIIKANKQLMIEELKKENTNYSVIKVCMKANSTLIRELTKENENKELIGDLENGN